MNEEELKRNVIWEMRINTTDVTLYWDVGQDFVNIGGSVLPRDDAAILCRAILGALGERQ